MKESEVGVKKVDWHPIGREGGYGTPGPAGLTGSVLPVENVWDWSIEDQMGNVLVYGIAPTRESAQTAVESHGLFQGE